MKILFLSAWYPNRLDYMSGLFVRKHAESVARYADVYTIYLTADENIKHTEIEEIETSNVKEIYVYYPFINAKILRPISKAFLYFYSFLKGYKYFKKKYGQQDITQANILTRSVFLAYLLKKKFNIPYIVIEHWSRYLPQNQNYKGFFRKRITELCVKNASHVFAVTSMLRKAMNNYNLNNKNFDLIDNVVDDFFYKNYVKKKNNIFQFLHISCFDEKPKNVCGILRAIKNLSTQRNDFKITFLGTGKDWQMAKNYADKLSINKEIYEFIGEKKPSEVCDYLSKSDCFILFSNYENAPVVISEALAMGVPIITSNVGGIPDMMNEDCGFLIEPKDEKMLTEKMNFMIDNNGYFSPEKIKSYSQRFRYDVVGKKLYECYKNILNE